MPTRSPTGRVWRTLDMRLILVFTAGPRRTALRSPRPGDAALALGEEICPGEGGIVAFDPRFSGTPRVGRCRNAGAGHRPAPTLDAHAGHRHPSQGHPDDADPAPDDVGDAARTPGRPPPG